MVEKFLNSYINYWAEGCVSLQGSKGETGDSIKGRPGVAGRPGRQGFPGLPGQRGPPGASGLPGPRGTKGMRGDAGFAGVIGLQGDNGRDGPPGNEGANGRDGIMGPKGERGLMGILGELKYTTFTTEKIVEAKNHIHHSTIFGINTLPELWKSLLDFPSCFCRLQGH